MCHSPVQFYLSKFKYLFIHSYNYFHWRYNDIAKYGFSAMGRPGINKLDPVRKNDASNAAGMERPTDLGR